jgi:hypothetical protein
MAVEQRGTIQRSSGGIGGGRDRRWVHRTTIDEPAERQRGDEEDAGKRQHDPGDGDVRHDGQTI